VGDARRLASATKAGTRELEIVFTMREPAAISKGEWLEELVFSVKHGGFDSNASNIALAWKDADREMNEIDIAVAHNLHFFCISCKTGSDATR
jgi:hypothetical protein